MGIVDRRTIPMTPNYYRWWDNFLETAFEYRGPGAVLFLVEDCDDDLSCRFKFSLTAEVYTDSPNGRYTTSVVSGIVPLVLPNSEADEAYNTGVKVNGNQRVNIGVFNFGEDSCSIRADVYDTFGEVVQTVKFEADPFTWQQKSIPAESHQREHPLAHFRNIGSPRLARYPPCQGTKAVFHGRCSPQARESNRRSRTACLVCPV